MTKSKTSNKLFSEIADDFALSGVGTSRFIEFSSCYLLINHQKSSYSKSFFINVGIIYKELLGRNLTANELSDALNLKNPSIPVHVYFRLESFPSAPPDLQEKFDHLISEGSINELKEVMIDALNKLFIFIENNHDRKTIRKLFNEKKLSASIRKEV